MLSVKNLSVFVDEKQILENISLDFVLGKTYYLL